MRSSLPRSGKALIEGSKLVEYVLSPTSERGRHKARVFESALGFNQSNWEQLKHSILDALPHHKATRISETAFGIKYQAVLSIVGANGRAADVMTVWQYDRLPNGSLQDAPRLVTLYVL